MESKKPLTISVLEKRPYDKMCPDRPTRFRTTISNYSLDEWKSKTFGELLKTLSKSHAINPGEKWAVMTKA